MGALSEISLIGNQAKTNNRIYDTIERYLANLKRNSKHTEIAYRNDIEKFFLETRGSNLENLFQSDLIYTIEEFEDYQTHLLDDLELASGTVNRHLTAVTEVFKHLKRRGMVENISFTEIQRTNDEADSYDNLTTDEVMDIVEYVKTQGRKKTALIKSKLILFSYDTCSRREECMSLKWSDFSELDENYMKVTTRVKGNKTMTRRISKQHYKELLEIKENGKDKVFNIGEATVDRMMADVRNHLHINENRRIVFHSIRKAGAQFIWESTRDLNQVRKMLGHESIRTTEIYINKNEDYGISGGYSTSHSVDHNLYKTAKKKNLLQAIKNLSKDKQMYINIELQKLETSI